jgi:catechol 2,3-dioxygenase-like lactoylglutathione lyase family enzyme
VATVGVGYIVDDVDAATDFYCRFLGFNEEMHPGLSSHALPRRPPGSSSARTSSGLIPLPKAGRRYCESPS